MTNETMDADELRSELEKHHRESYGWALSCCGQNTNEAEDVLQNVYVKILDGRARFRGQASFKTWLLALVRNTVADHWRQKSRHIVKLINYEKTAESPMPDEDPGETMDRTQIQALLKQAMALLPTRQQEAVRLVFYHDLSVSEAAQVMGVSLGSARTHYERGKEKLRQWVEKAKVFDEIGFGRE